MATLSADLADLGEIVTTQPCALVIAELPERSRAAREALALAGIRIAGEVRFGDAAARLGQQALADIVVIDALGVADEVLEAALADVERFADASGARIVAAIGKEQIDLAATRLIGMRRQLLCEPDMAELCGALTMAKAPPSTRVHQASREAESERLHRLNEEVARIADTLARLSRGEDGGRLNGVRAAGSAYRGSDDLDDDISPQEIRTVIRSRRLRAQFFTGDLFADPAWDMLLDLFAAGLEGRRVSVSSLCIAAAVPPTTALRWISTLHEAELFERHADPSDRRRAYIALSDKGLEGMRCYAASAKRQGLPLV